MIGNDDLRLRLQDLTDSQLRAVLRDHYSSVAERMGQSEREALEMALIDHVDQRGDAERERLSVILAPFSPQPAATIAKPNGKSPMPYTEQNLAITVATVSTKVDIMTETLKSNQQRLQRIEEGLAPLAGFDIDDWFGMKATLAALQRQGQTLLVMVVGGSVMSLVVLAALLLLALRHLI